MTRASPPPYTMVTQRSHLLAVCDELARAPRIALDTESDSMHHYPERVCLVQAATPEATYILDPFALEDLSPLELPLGDRRVLKLLHGADYDLRGLNRDWYLEVDNLFDTHLAARFLGMERVGLAALLSDLLGVEIPKDRRLQRADWSQRPLGGAALDYAAADVRHLFALHDALAERLRAVGRLSWLEDECARLAEVRHGPLDLTATVQALPEARAMTGHQRAVLLALYRYREAEARRQDRPPSRLLPPKALAAIALLEPGESLDAVPEVTPGQVQRYGRGLRAAVRDGLASPPLESAAPTGASRSRPTQAQGRRLAALRAWRTALANELSMDVALVWPIRSLERLARDPAGLADELTAPEVRSWQAEAFGEALRRALASG